MLLTMDTPSSVAPDTHLEPGTLAIKVKGVRCHCFSPILNNKLNMNMNMMVLCCCPQDKQILYETNQSITTSHVIGWIAMFRRSNYA